MRRLLLGIPNTPSPDAPDGARRARQRGAADRGLRRGGVRRAPAGAALGHRHRAEDPRLRAGGQDLGLDVHHVPGGGRPAAAGADASSPSTATPTPTRRSGRRPWCAPRPWCRPATCRSSPTTPTTSSATTCGPSPPPRCRSRRCGRDEIFDEADLPLRLMAHTSCYPAGGRLGRPRHPGPAAGPRVRQGRAAGLPPRPSRRSRARRTSCARAEALLADLGLAYRVLDLCAGDLGGSAARTCDLEVYAPGVDQWLEVSSVSWFTDYQARRANIRYRAATGGKGDRGGPHGQRVGLGCGPAPWPPSSRPTASPTARSLVPEVAAALPRRPRADHRPAEPGGQSRNRRVDQHSL